MTPHRGAETENAECDQHRALREDQPFGDQTVEQGVRADAAGERDQRGARPGGVGSLGRQYGTIGGKPRRAVGAVLDGLA